MTIHVNVLGFDTCNACPRRGLIRNGMNALHRTGTLSGASAVKYVARACHGCVAEASVEEDRQRPGEWTAYLLSYADDPDGEPMPADGGPR